MEVIHNTLSWINHNSIEGGVIGGLPPIVADITTTNTYTTITITCFYVQRTLRIQFLTHKCSLHSLSPSLSLFSFASLTSLSLSPIHLGFYNSTSTIQRLLNRLMEISKFRPRSYCVTRCEHSHSVSRFTVPH